MYTKTMMISSKNKLSPFATYTNLLLNVEYAFFKAVFHTESYILHIMSVSWKICSFCRNWLSLQCILDCNFLTNWVIKVGLVLHRRWMNVEKHIVHHLNCSMHNKYQSFQEKKTTKKPDVYYFLLCLGNTLLEKSQIWQKVVS